MSSASKANEKLRSTSNFPYISFEVFISLLLQIDPIDLIGLE